MSKQINFYIPPEEETELVEFIFSLGLAIYPNRVYKSNEMDGLSSISEYQASKSTQFIYYLAPLGTKILTTKKETGFVINWLESTVLEYSRPRLFDQENRVFNGRFWYETQRYDQSGEKIRVNEVLDSYYNKLVKEIKTICIKYPNRNHYISKKIAEQFIQKKYRFEG